MWMMTTVCMSLSIRFRALYRPLLCACIEDCLLLVNGKYCTCAVCIWQWHAVNQIALIQSVLYVLSSQSKPIDIHFAISFFLSFAPKNQIYTLCDIKQKKDILSKWFAFQSSIQYLSNRTIFDKEHFPINDNNQKAERKNWFIRSIPMEHIFHIQKCM